ncbi:MAG: phytase [Henriciella sp.]|nr:phytase [Henriciella sp.]
MTKSLLVPLGFLSLTACATAPEVLPFPVVPVAASIETEPMLGEGDKADDPAIWINTGNPAQSLVLGTNKDEGLHVYTLDGAEVQFLDVGQLNNVDIRSNLAVASNDEFGGLSWFQITGHVDAPVVHIGNTAIEKIEPYGVCLGDKFGKSIAAVTYKDGTVQFWEGEVESSDSVSAELVHTIKLDSQLEGCVFDEAHDRIFIGEEAYGIWSLDLSGPDAQPIIVDTIENGNGLVADVEGLTLLKGAEGAGYLIASAQEADRFVVYDRLPPHAPRGIFTVTGTADGSIDSVSHTDGLDVMATPLPNYPNGLLVVQDDGNPASGVDQNFKLVDWARVEQALGLSN